MTTRNPTGAELLEGLDSFGGYGFGDELAILHEGDTEGSSGGLGGLAGGTCPGPFTLGVVGLVVENEVPRRDLPGKNDEGFA
jgi:hypothetical protein